MTRLRVIPTSMRSAKHLVQALESGGLRLVERHSEPQPLLSWRGRPLAESAEIIVRRAQIGATADDFGFVRGPSGAFDALVSEIHLSRFDRRWFAELEKRYAALLAADSFGEEPAPVPAAPAGFGTARETAKPSFEPRTRLVEAHAAIATPAPKSVLSEAPIGVSVGDGVDVQRELGAFLVSLRRGPSPIGCLALMGLWIVVSFSMLASRSGPGPWAVTTVIAFVVGQKLLRRQFEQRALQVTAEFRSRFSHDTALRAAALRRLREATKSMPPGQRKLALRVLDRLGG